MKETMCSVEPVGVECKVTGPVVPPMFPSQRRREKRATAGTQVMEKRVRRAPRGTSRTATQSCPVLSC